MAHEGTHYVTGLVVVRVDDPLGAGDAQLREAAESVSGQLVEEGEPVEGLNLDNEAIQRLRSLVGLIRVDDAEEAAALLRESGLQAARVAGLHFLYHYVSGETKPTRAQSRSDLEIADMDHPESYVAMVDSGVAPKDRLPTWMRESVLADPADREDLRDGVSHGTFVASLIRQVAKYHGVSVAKAGVPVQYVRPDSVFENEANRRPATTEAHVSDAILRLIERHRREPDKVEALNISLGADFDDEESENELVLLRTALAVWTEAHPDAPIVAAAGNSQRNQPVYPAAAPEVTHSVAAANANGDEIVWEDIDDDAQPSEIVWAANNTEERDWVNALAPGSNLWGAGGRADDDFVCWSGSSFASALVAAAVVENRPSTPAGTRTQWLEADLSDAVTDHCEPPAQAG